MTIFFVAIHFYDPAAVLLCMNNILDSSQLPYIVSWSKEVKAVGTIFHHFLGINNRN